ncbi:MAG TPA: hypothetical protein VFI31_26735, partial [Pirellulales bacterium]|nr:hypothetical protein [Pirellulales bacterium]
GAPPSRPPCEERRLVALRIHESLARRLMNRVIGDDFPARLTNPFEPAVLFGSIENLAFGSNAVSWSAWPAPKEWRSQSWAWGLVRDSLAPQLTSDGVTLREGRWGTILPVSLAGEWWAAEWRPASAVGRVAAVAGNHQER